MRPGSLVGKPAQGPDNPFGKPGFGGGFFDNRPDESFVGAFEGQDGCREVSFCPHPMQGLQAKPPARRGLHSQGIDMGLETIVHLEKAGQIVTGRPGGLPAQKPEMRGLFAMLEAQLPDECRCGGGLFRSCTHGSRPPRA